MPVVNAWPDIITYDLTEQTAVDVAQQTDPMVAAQKLRDFAISYDAEGSTMIMVIGVADLFKGAATIPATVDKRKKCGIGIIDRTLDRLKEEVLLDTWRSSSPTSRGPLSRDAYHDAPTQQPSPAVPAPLWRIRGQD
ncbi:hypothetical protein FB451DRAFT_1305156 [Mycena latifolia]|nr:hypothetical protein FB451DRAFT_1305156 [Mycena latifolia]